MSAKTVITAEQMGKAIAEAHIECADDHCIHAAPTKACERSLFDVLSEIVEEDDNPILGAYFLGLHVGYRLDQIVMGSLPKEKMN